jgi:phage terminase small subunit
LGGKGSGGHNKKPDYLKKLEGTWRKDRSKGRNYENGEELLTGYTPPKERSSYTPPRAPSTLGQHGQRLFHKVVRGWRLDDGELFLLERACEAMDELKAAQEVLARTGETTIDSKGVEVPHPCCQLRKEARLALLRFWDKLNLDHSPLED